MAKAATGLPENPFKKSSVAHPASLIQYAGNKSTQYIVKGTFGVQNIYFALSQHAGMKADRCDDEGGNVTLEFSFLGFNIP